jgi:hypothetical protein
MSERKSKLQRAIDYFRTASQDEARVAFLLVKEIMEARTPAVDKPKPPVRRTRVARKPPVIPPAMAKVAAASGESLADA